MGISLDDLPELETGDAELKRNQQQIVPLISETHPGNQARMVLIPK